MNIYLPYIIALTVSIVFIIILSVVSLSYHKLLKKYYKIKNKEALLKSEARAKAISLTEAAKDNVEKMMEEANLKAVEVVHQANIFNNEQAKSFEEELKRINEAEFDEYKSQLSDIRSEFLSEARSAVEDFEKLIRQDMNSVRSQVSNAVAASEKAAEAEIQEFKRAKIEEVSKMTQGIIEKVAQEALGRSLTREDHRDLIMKALERAKSEDVL